MEVGGAGLERWPPDLDGNESLCAELGGSSRR